MRIFPEGEFEAPADWASAQGMSVDQSIEPVSGFMFQLRHLSGGGMLVKIEATIDKKLWHDVGEEIALAPGGNVLVGVSDPAFLLFRQFQVRVKSQVQDQPAVVAIVGLSR